MTQWEYTIPEMLSDAGYVFDKAWTLELRYARQRLRDTIDADLRTTDQFIERRIKSSFQIVDLLKGR